MRYVGNVKAADGRCARQWRVPADRCSHVSRLPLRLQRRADQYPVPDRYRQRVLDKRPPLYYRTGITVNANTDVRHLRDTIGRFYWARAAVSSDLTVHWYAAQARGFAGTEIDSTRT